MCEREPRPRGVDDERLRRVAALAEGVHDRRGTVEVAEDDLVDALGEDEVGDGVVQVGELVGDGVDRGLLLARRRG